MKVCEYSRSMSFLDFGPRSFRLAFLRNHWANFSQILCVSFKVHGNEIQQSFMALQVCNFTDLKKENNEKDVNP